MEQMFILGMEWGLAFLGFVLVVGCFMVFVLFIISNFFIDHAALDRRIAEKRAVQDKGLK